MENVDLITSAVVEYRNAMGGKPQCSVQSLLDSDDVPALILNDGIIIAANKAALDSFGLGLKGLSFRSILVDESTRVDEFEESIEERGRSRPKIFSVRNSTQRWRAEGRKLGGETSEVIVRLKDVTEANATYAAFRKKNNQLLLEVSELELKRVRLESALKIFEGVFQSAAIGIEIRKFTGERVLVNDAFKKIAQLPLLDDGVVNQVMILSNDGHEINLDSLVSDIQDSESNCHVFECKVGSEATSAVCCRATSSLMPTSGGSSHVILTVYEDIDAQKRTEESNRLLLNEVSHRAKNALAVVQGLAIQIFRQDMPKDVLLKAL